MWQLMVDVSSKSVECERVIFCAIVKQSIHCGGGEQGCFGSGGDPPSWWILCCWTEPLSRGRRLSGKVILFLRALGVARERIWAAMAR